MVKTHLLERVSDYLCYEMSSAEFSFVTITNIYYDKRCALGSLHLIFPDHFRLDHGMTVGINGEKVQEAAKDFFGFTGTVYQDHYIRLFSPGYEPDPIVTDPMIYELGVDCSKEKLANNIHKYIQFLNKHQKQTTMSKTNFFSKEGVKEAKDAIEKRKEEFGFDDRLPRIQEPGIYELIMGAPVLRESKKGSGNDRLEVPCYVDKDHEPINRIFDFFTETGSRILIEFMLNAFEYDFKPIESEDEVDIAAGIVKQVKQYQTKKFKAAVKIKEKLYEKEGKVTVHKFPELWYVGTINSDMQIDINKAYVPLSKEDKAKLARAAEGAAETPPADDEKKTGNGKGKKKEEEEADVERYPWDDPKK